MLYSKQDTRWPDIGMRGHTMAETRVQEDRVGTEVYYRTRATLSLAHTPSVIALGCLDGGDERGEGQGLLLNSTWLRARYRYCNKVESKG